MLSILEALHPQTKPTIQPNQPLLEALTRLEIEPFDKARVETYKAEHLEKVWSFECSRYAKLGYRDITAGGSGEINYPLRSVLGFEWCVPGAKYMYLIDGKDQPTPTISNPAGYRIPFVFALKWDRRPANQCGYEVPEFVKHKMCLIESAVPGVTFETDTLKSIEQPYDPFLIAKLGDEEYYVEVWGDDDRTFPR